VYRGGLCRNHYAVSAEKEWKQCEAKKCLDNGLLEGRPFQNAELKDELTQLRRLWWRICTALNANGAAIVLDREAFPAVHRCLLLAQQIIKEEQGIRIGNNKPLDKENRAHHWDWLNEFERDHLARIEH
jgi:hypothetical protein